MGLLNGKQTVTSKTELSPEQAALTGLAMPFAQQYAAGEAKNPTKIAAANLIAQPNALQKSGENMALGAVGGQQDLANAGKDASVFALTKALFPESNPALQSTIDASVRPIQQNLMESTLPGLRSGASMAGQYGSSRQGIAEGLASGRASQAIGDTSSKVATAGYTAGLDALTKALGLLPQTQAAQLTPGLTTSGVGDVRQNQAQQLLDAKLQAKLFNSMHPADVAARLTGLANSVGGGSTTSTANNPANPISTALGGASLGRVLGPALGIGAGAGTAAGAGLGGLLAFL